MAEGDELRDEGEGVKEKHEKKKSGYLCNSVSFKAYKKANVL